MRLFNNQSLFESIQYNLRESDNPFYSFQDSGQDDGLLGRLWFNIDNSDKYYTADLMKIDGEYRLVTSNILLDTDKDLRNFIDTYGYDKLLDKAISYYKSEKGLNEESPIEVVSVPDEEAMVSTNGRKPVGTYSLTNTGGLLIYEINNRDDEVLVGLSTQPDKAMWLPIEWVDSENGKEVEAGFYWGDAFINLHEVMRTELHESYAIVEYYDKDGNQQEKVINGTNIKAVENKVKRIADKYEVKEIRQASADLSDNEYLNSLGDGVLRSDYNNSTFEESNLKESIVDSIQVGDEVYWVGAGNEIGASGKVIDLPTEGRMTVKWDDGDVNTYDVDHPSIVKAELYDNSFNECDKKLTEGIEEKEDYEVYEIADGLVSKLRAKGESELASNITNTLNGIDRANNRGAGYGSRLNKKLRDLVKQAQEKLNESTLKEDTNGDKYIIFARGGMISDRPFGDDIFNSKEEAKEALKSWKNSYGRNKSYYRPDGSIYKYKGKTPNQMREENKNAEQITESTDNEEWKAICKEFCKQIGAELLFVNNDNFGYMDKDGNMIHMYADELEQYLKNKMSKRKINEASHFDSEDPSFDEKQVKYQKADIVDLAIGYYKSHPEEIKDEIDNLYKSYVNGLDNQTLAEKANEYLIDATEESYYYIFGPVDDKQRFIINTPYTDDYDGGSEISRVLKDLEK